MNFNDKIFVSIVGSRAQGAATETSDIDFKSCFIEDTVNTMGLFGYEDYIREQDTKTDHVSDEVARYLRELLRSDVNALEAIYSPLLIYTGEYFEELEGIAKQCITTKLAIQYSGIANSAYKHASKEEWLSPKFKKWYRNSIRALFSGIYVLQTGKFNLNYMDLMNKYDFKVNYDNFHEDHENWQDNLKYVLERSELPEEVPDELQETANELLLKIRRDKFDISRWNL